MKRLILTIAIAGCASADTDFPIQPQGGPPTTSGPQGEIRGRVCLLVDPRMLATCAEVGAGGLTVTLGSHVAPTASDGTFTMAAPTGTNLAFTVSGSNIVTSQQPFAPINTIPALSADLFDQVLAANGIVLTPGSGSIFASVADRGGTPVPGVLATSTPSPAFGPFFDGTTPTAWTLDGTGSRGVVFFPGVTTGPSTVTFNDLATSGETTIDGIQVVDGGLTFVDAVLP